MSQVSRIENPFGNNNQVASRPSTALVDTESQRAIAEVQASLAIAKRFPRDQIAAMDRILNACQRPRMAESAVYQYARGGTSVTGPSIRLAEMLAQNWGNMQYGVRELSQSNGESTVEAFAWDLETNTRQTKIFQVPHIRYTRSGSKRLEDPRDIYELISNNGSRRVRACILGVIPGDVVDAAVSQCDQTLRASADISPAAVQKLVTRFEDYGVTKEMIEKRIQCRVDAIKPAQVMSLIKIGTSLKEGMSSADDWFDMKTVNAEPEGAANDINSKINAGQQSNPETRGSRGRGRATPEPTPTPQPETTPEPEKAKPAPVKTKAEPGIKISTEPKLEPTVPNEPAGFFDDEVTHAQPANDPERVAKVLESIEFAKTAAAVDNNMRYTQGLNDADLATIKDAIAKRNRELMATPIQTEKPSLKARMEACTDSNELGILSSEIEFLDPAIQQAMWTVYDECLNKLNA